MPVPSKPSPCISDFSTALSAAVLSSSDLNYTILSILEKLFHPFSTPEQQILGSVIRVLARQASRLPGTDYANSDDELNVLLAVSIALKRAERAGGAAPPASVAPLPGSTP